MAYQHTTRTPAGRSVSTSRQAPCCKPKPCACPACGGLECLCRPRFFAGQLLTDEDLNRLDHYIVAKSRLHNRYLHGWGVVCGLEVLCHDCKNLVTVSSGYALGPCGEDIVVCAEETVDVCALIRKCREQERHWQCEPCPPYHEAEDCEELTEEWILSIRYDERATRGVTPLRRSEAACSCECGGSCECGCECGGSGSDSCGCKETKGSSCKPKPPECEPTVICEGYAFELCRVPQRKEADEVEEGALLERFQECLGRIKEFLPQATDPGAPPQDEHQWLCQARESLYHLFSEHPTTNCDWCSRLAKIACPPPSPDDPTGSAAQIQQAKQQIIELIMEYFIHCLCSALLPPCPAPVCDPRVPLASIKVRKKDCKILKICNWTIHRRFAVTFPNLRYWLSWLPFGRDLRELIEKLCCHLEGVLIRGEPAFVAQPENAVAGEARAGAARPKMKSTAAFTGLAGDAFADRAVAPDPSRVALGLLGGRDSSGEPLLSDEERSNMTQFALLNYAGGTVFNAVAPEQIGNLLGGLAAVAGEPGGEKLRDEVAELRRTVRGQADLITQLTDRLDALG